MGAEIVNPEKEDLCNLLQLQGLREIVWGSEVKTEGYKISFAYQQN